MRPKFRIQIITPQGIAYKGDAVHSLIPSEDGYVGILANHAAYVTTVSGGTARVDETDDIHKEFKIGPGFFTVSENGAILLTRSCEERALPA